MVVTICKELRIDDPIYWMNNTDPKVIDLWIADRILTSQEEGGKTNSNQSPESVLGGIINSITPQDGRR
jgi:hypothetical protein